MDGNIVDREQISAAITALRLYIEQKKRKDLLVTDTEIHLQFSVKKVSIKHKTLKIQLPHSIVDEMAAVCLFVADADRNTRDYSDTVDSMQQRLTDAGVKRNIEIIPLKRLKLEFKEFENKRKLLTMYDVFLADESIVRLLPPQLGKHFYAKKRHLLQVNLKKNTIQKEIDRALCTAQCTTGRGSSGQLSVATLSQSSDDIIENVMSAVSQLTQSLAGGALNLRSLNLKVQDGPSLAIYLSSGLKEDVKWDSVKRKKTVVPPEDVTTIDGKVSVTGRGVVKVTKVPDDDIAVKPEIPTEIPDVGEIPDVTVTTKKRKRTVEVTRKIKKRKMSS